MINVRSIRGKIAEFCYYVNQCTNVIFCLTETWLGSMHTDAIFGNVCSTHIVYRTDRNELGGGVALLLPKCLSSVSAFSESIGLFEAHTLDLIYKNRPYLRLTLVYRTPTANKHASTNALLAYINQVTTQRSENLILGDFNYPDINWHFDNTVMAPAEFNFYSRMLELGYFQIIDAPTHDHGHTLDLVFVQDLSVVSRIEIQPPPVFSDHLAVCFDIGPFDHNSRQGPGETFYNYNKTNFDAISAQLAATNWGNFFAGVFGVDQMWSKFLTYFMDCLHNNTPLCDLRFRKNHWSVETRKAHKRQEKLHKKYSRTKLHCDRLAWIAAAKLSRKLKRRDAHTFEEKILASKNDRRFWGYVRSKIKPRSEIPVLISGDRYIDDPRSKADLFNNFFASVFQEDNGVPIPGLPRVLESNIRAIEISAQTVSHALKSLAPKHSSGPDNIPQFVLAKLVNVLYEPLMRIFDTSFVTGVVPIQWKIGKVTPIHKKGLKTNVQNYRPISLLCGAEKVMEIIIRDQLVEFLEDNDLINSDQFGFRNRRSTVAQLLLTVEEWTNALDNRKNVDSVFLDIRKAFDSVSHSKMVQILESKGVSGPLLKWFQNYLSDRQQFVFLDDTESNCRAVKSGVPQGSTLGPILFLLYMDGLGANFQHLSKKLFADDAKLYHVFGRNDMVDIRPDLEATLNWTNTMQMEMAFEKCSVMHFGFHNPQTPYSFGNHDLEVCLIVRDLGVFVSPSLTFSEHCAHISKVGFMKVNLIYSNFITRRWDFLVKMYIVFVRPGLEYASEVWSPLLIKDIELVERVQRRFTKRLPGLQTNSYEERLHVLGLETLQRRRTVRDLIMTYKIINGLIDLNVGDFFVFSHNQRTRGHPFKLIVPQARLNIRKNSFSNRVVNTWNSLPAEMVATNSLSDFKRRLQNYQF